MNSKNKSTSKNKDKNLKVLKSIDNLKCPPLINNHNFPQYSNKIHNFKIVYNNSSLNSNNNSNNSNNNNNNNSQYNLMHNNISLQINIYKNLKMTMMKIIY